MADPFGPMEPGEFGYVQDFSEIIGEARESVREFAEGVREETARLRTEMAWRQREFEAEARWGGIRAGWLGYARTEFAEAAAAFPPAQEAAREFYGREAAMTGAARPPGYPVSQAEWLELERAAMAGTSAMIGQWNAEAAARYAARIPPGELESLGRTMAMLTGAAGAGAGGAPPGGAPPGGVPPIWGAGLGPEAEMWRQSALRAVEARQSLEAQQNMQRETVYRMWYLRVLQQQIDVLGDLGRGLLDTSREWVRYAGGAESAGNVMEMVARTHGVSADALAAYEEILVQHGYTVAQARSELAEYMRLGLDLETIVPAVAGAMGVGGGSLNAVMQEQWYLSARLKEEFGEALLPAYKGAIGIINDVKETFVESSDAMQNAIAIGTVTAGTFLSVGAGVASAIVSLAGLLAVARSVLPVLGLSGTAAAGLAGGIGLAAAAGVGAYASFVAVSEQLKEIEHNALEASRTYEEYVGMVEEGVLSTNVGIAVQQRFGGVLDESVVAGLMRSVDAWEEAKRAIEEYGAVLESISAEAVVGAAAAAAATIPAFAEAFGGLSRKAEEIQNEMETNRRRHAYVMEEITKRGYDQQLVAESEGLDAQYRKLEIALMESEAATQRALGGIVINWIQAAMEVGRVDFAQGIEMQLDAMESFGIASEQNIQKAREMARELGLFAVQQQTWGETIAGLGGIAREGTAGIVMNLPAVTAEAVTITAAHVTVIGGEAPAGYQYLPLPALREYTVAEEARTEGVRTRR